MPGSSDAAAVFSTSDNGDSPLSAVATLLFSYSLGTLSVIVPLLAVSAGYTHSHVGLLVAVTAVAQLATRLLMGALLRIFADKWLLIAASLMIAASCVLILASHSLLVFALAQLAQGMARALFWTGSQTHAVRGSLPAVEALRNVNLAAGVGALLGPVAAGYLWGVSSQLPLLVGAIAGCVTVIPLSLIVRFQPFAARTSVSGVKEGHLWRRPGVDTACLMSVGAGAWRSLLDSYIPLALSLAGQPPAVIGVLLSMANAAVLAGSVAGGRVRSWGMKASLVAGVLTTGLGLAATGLLASFAGAAGAALALSGVGAGILQTVGPAIAAEVVHPEERGEALAVTGTFRASALFLVPFGMAGMVTFVPVTAAVLIAGLIVLAPAAGTFRWHPGGK